MAAAIAAALSLAVAAPASSQDPTECRELVVRALIRVADRSDESASVVSQALARIGRIGDTDESALRGAKALLDGLDDTVLERTARELIASRTQEGAQAILRFSEGASREQLDGLRRLTVAIDGAPPPGTLLETLIARSPTRAQEILGYAGRAPADAVDGVRRALGATVPRRDASELLEVLISAPAGKLSEAGKHATIGAFGTAVQRDREGAALLFMRASDDVASGPNFGHVMELQVAGAPALPAGLGTVTEMAVDLKPGSVFNKIDSETATKALQLKSKADPDAVFVLGNNVAAGEIPVADLEALIDQAALRSKGPVFLHSNPLDENLKFALNTLRIQAVPWPLVR